MQQSKIITIYGIIVLEMHHSADSGHTSHSHTIQPLAVKCCLKIDHLDLSTTFISLVKMNKKSKCCDATRTQQYCSHHLSHNHLNSTQQCSAMVTAMVQMTKVPVINKVNGEIVRIWAKIKSQHYSCSMQFCAGQQYYAFIILVLY